MRRRHKLLLSQNLACQIGRTWNMDENAAVAARMFMNVMSIWHDSLFITCVCGYVCSVVKLSTRNRAFGGESVGRTVSCRHSAFLLKFVTHTQVR